MRVLDEVADAIRIARGGIAHPVRSAVGIEDMFGGPVTSRQWAAMQQHLGCPLPPMEFDQGHWFRTDDLATIWDLVDHVACYRFDWEMPPERTVAVWRNAQVFAGVRSALVDSCALDPEEVVRPAKLKHILQQ